MRGQGVIELDRDRFNDQFQRFKNLIPVHNKGHAFTNGCGSSS